MKNGTTVLMAAAGFVQGQAAIAAVSVSLLAPTSRAESEMLEAVKRSSKWELT
jgi:hypothetical protein